jgi:hypothetical protein
VPSKQWLQDFWAYASTLGTKLTDISKFHGLSLIPSTDACLCTIPSSSSNTSIFIHQPHTFIDEVFFKHLGLHFLDSEIMGCELYLLQAVIVDFCLK